jgi:hypothetical protein
LIRLSQATQKEISKGAVLPVCMRFEAGEAPLSMSTPLFFPSTIVLITFVKEHRKARKLLI